LKWDVRNWLRVGSSGEARVTDLELEWPTTHNVKDCDQITVHAQTQSNIPLLFREQG